MSNQPRPSRLPYRDVSHLKCAVHVVSFPDVIGQSLAGLAATHPNGDRMCRCRRGRFWWDFDGGALPNNICVLWFGRGALMSRWYQNISFSLILCRMVLKLDTYTLYMSLHTLGCSNTISHPLLGIQWGTHREDNSGGFGSWKMPCPSFYDLRML